MDGVNGITECPIAPGRNKTYTFVATQVGNFRVLLLFGDGKWPSVASPLSSNTFSF